MGLRDLFKKSSGVYNCFDFNDEWYLIEMSLSCAPSEINWAEIVVPEEGVSESNWQCAYIEQYLDEGGTTKLCEAYDIPDTDASTSRVAFFIYKTEQKTLRTPYGEFKLRGGKPVPDRLKNIIEFDGD